MTEEKKPKKTPVKAGTADTTSITVDAEESRIADSILEVLEQQKGKHVLRMLRVNRISILRLALGIGLNGLTGKVEREESIL